MTIVRVGSTEKYSDGWDRAFKKKRTGTAAKKKATPAKSPTKKKATQAKKATKAKRKKKASSRA